ncbi:hypothetical protein HMJ29_02495 [Hymenobacter taeanensis]|uniref:Uncharacterized protein n=1 Tax=Hymenobacter taeanensis TaxID=2735321 RepID=A0A6M6BFD5_9BACT|nr:MULTISPECIES: hypothetical protein [Hymenobacter]QJX45865.1 hypothetical protein HMJ29_02495 [Hymenobacter taeanensis]UOQ79710.1 hypothetical protein MUN83_12710 [Hymenobacter sp. 5414T-23]
MSKLDQAPYTSEQLQTALDNAYDNMLAFKRYKQTPVVIVRDGQVVEVSPDEVSADEQKAA